MIGIDPAGLSLWEYQATVAGWNDAHRTEEQPPPAMSDAAFDALMAEVG